MMKKLIPWIPMICWILFASGCARGGWVRTAPEDGITSGEVDYSEMLEWAGQLSLRMTTSGVLDGPRYEPGPVTMVLARQDNRSDMSRFPWESVTGRVEAALINSGKVELVSTFGEGATDMPQLIQEIRIDPRYDQGTIPRAGLLKVARLSMDIKILMRAARSGRERQNTYEVQVRVVDNQTGTTVWIGFSDPISKVSRKPRIGIGRDF